MGEGVACLGVTPRVDAALGDRHGHAERGNDGNARRVYHGYHELNEDEGREVLCSRISAQVRPCQALVLLPP